MKENNENTRLGRAVDVLDKWAFYSVVLAFYYWASVKIIADIIDTSNRARSGEIFECGNALIAPITGHVFIAVIVFAVLFVRMQMGARFSKKNYWFTFYAVILPLVVNIVTYSI